MALERIWCLASRTQDKTIGTFTDETVYGGANLLRNQEAHFIVIAKMDFNQQLTVIANIDNSDPLNDLSYQFAVSADGAYRLIAFNPAFFSASVNYVVGNIVWQGSSASFYKAKAISGIATTPYTPSVTVGWENYWDLITDFSEELENPLVNMYIHDDIVTFNFEECLMTELEEINDDILCGVCTNFQDLIKVNSMQLLLAGANSNNWQGKQEKSEVILVEATKKFCC